MGWIALTAEPGLSYSEFVLPSIVAGVVVSMAIPSAQNSVVGAVAENDLGKAAGANSMMREFGGVFRDRDRRRRVRRCRQSRLGQRLPRRFAPAIAVLAAISLAGARSPSRWRAAGRGPHPRPSVRCGPRGRLRTLITLTARGTAGPTAPRSSSCEPCPLISARAMDFAAAPDLHRKPTEGMT
jgi:hypothetical protein